MAPLPADASAPDHYRVLGVERGATDAEIARAYKKLALKHHPDKNPESKERAEAKFRSITEAYEVLRDPEKRRHYDALGLEGWRDSGLAGHGVSASHADEIFSAFFGGRMGGDFLSPPAAGRAAGAAAAGVPWGSERFVFDLQGGRGRGGGGGTGAPTPAAAPHAKPPRTRVVVHGLAKSPEHNGKTGEISRWDAARERYEVQLEGGGALSLRPQSVTQLCAVEVAGLESKPELNGSRGRVFNFDEASGRYMVLLDSPAVAVGLQPGNCVLLDPGARVLLQGLCSCPQLNGQMAQVLGVDREAARYTVRCQGGKQVKVRYDSVVC